MDEELLTDEYAVIYMYQGHVYANLFKNREAAVDFENVLITLNVKSTNIYKVESI